MDEVKLIDSSELKETLNMEAALGYIHTLQDVERVIDARPAAELKSWPDWQHGKPPEHESIFYKFKGTDKWRPGMFEMTSGEVLVTIEVPVWIVFYKARGSAPRNVYKRPRKKQGQNVPRHCPRYGRTVGN